VVRRPAGPCGDTGDRRGPSGGPRAPVTHISCRNGRNTRRTDGDFRPTKKGWSNGRAGPLAPCYCRSQLQLWFPNTSRYLVGLPGRLECFCISGISGGAIIAATRGPHSAAPGTAPKEK